MIRHYIISYVKKEQSFLASLNSMCDATGQIYEPYEVTLKKVSWWFYKSVVKKNVELPRGFNHEKEFTRGREFTF